MLEVVTADWTLDGELLVEPRLAEAGLRHGMTTLAADMSRYSAVLACRQEHGIMVREARPGQPVGAGDGLVSRSSGLAVGVFSADCVPLLLWSSDGRAVGAFHAGWRGLAAGMGRAAAAAMAGAKDVHAAVGPHIGPCCYEVGPELRGRFPDDRFVVRSERLYLDLGAEARAQLEAGGLAPERIAVSALCTSCRPDLASWRRDRVKRNMLTFIAPA